MRILLTNDDGVWAPGLRALLRQLAPEHEVEVVAPDKEQSGVGHGITVHHPLRVARVDLGAGVEAFTVSGTPADCVKLAFDALLDRPPDIVISGVNDGVNLGTDVLYSGTVAAAVEGCLFGAPAMAVSLDGRDEPGYAFAARVAEAIALRMVEEGLPPNSLLNVNVPKDGPEGVRGVRVTRLGQRRYRDVFDRRSDPRGREYYWLAGNPVDLETDDVTTDAAALRSGYVSITPIHVDMTDFESMERLSRWKFDRLL